MGLRDVIRDAFADGDDFLDGCDLARFGEPTRDEDVPWLVLFASRFERDDLVILHLLADALRSP